MLTDVVSEFERVTGAKHEAIFYTFYILTSKVIPGLTRGLQQLVIGYQYAKLLIILVEVELTSIHDSICLCSQAGYKVSECIQPPSVGEALHYLQVGPPLILVSFVLVALYFYPIPDPPLPCRKRVANETDVN